MTLATQVQEAVEAYCNIKLSSTAITVYLDGGDGYLLPKIGPILSITSITDTFSSQVTSDDLILTATAYSFYEGHGAIYRYDDEDWDEGRRRWKVIYNAGYTTVPEDIQLAMNMWVDLLTNNASGSLSSYSTGDDSESYSDLGDIPKSIKHLLNKYKRVVFNRLS